MRKLKLLSFIFTATVGATQWQGKVPNFRKPGYHLECYKCDNAGKDYRESDKETFLFRQTCTQVTKLNELPVTAFFGKIGLAKRK